MTSGPALPAAARRRTPNAKVNLGLAITGRRADGYHLLRSVLIRLALHDDLEVAISSGASDSLEVRGDPACPVDGNLVLRASAKLRAAAGRPLPGLAFQLEKRIPTAAGLGGGSSDAAAALDLALVAWGIALDDERRDGIALALGADVPFFAGVGPAALVDGIGERVTRLPAPSPPAGVLLVTPGARLRTAAVFATWDASASEDGAAARVVERLAESLRGGMTGEGLASSAVDLRDANDLWLPATILLPALGALREDLEAGLGRPVLMTGSGSTLVALYPSPDAAADAAAMLAHHGQARLADARIIATSTVTEGPS